MSRDDGISKGSEVCWQCSLENLKTRGATSILIYQYCVYFSYNKYVPDVEDKMSRKKVWFKKAFVAFGILAIGLLFLNAEEGRQDLKTVLPQLEGWELSESPESYLPANLFEYINGAAEIYLSYDFEELIVGQYRKKGAEANVSVEIYDMGDSIQAFGIYGAERYPENVFISAGTQGYLEDDVLNFLVGDYYVKLMCFDCKENSGSALKAMAESIDGRVKEKAGFPEVLSRFPKKGLVANSEKFNLRNVMGYSFLSMGYQASYLLDGMEFACFLIQGKDEAHAAEMMQKYLDKKGGLPMDKTEDRVRISDRYYDNIFLSRTGSFICGVMKIAEGAEVLGEKYLQVLKAGLVK
jgi:hypothetical protein